MLCGHARIRLAQRALRHSRDRRPRRCAFELLLDDASAGEFGPAFDRAIMRGTTHPNRCCGMCRARCRPSSVLDRGDVDSRLHEPLVRAVVLHARDMTPLAEARARLSNWSGACSCWPKPAPMC